MLDVFGKAQPYTMKPALQIDKSNARLLVEALSGRWSYEDERRDKRTLWSYVARAFSLCIDRIDPGGPPLLPPFEAKWGNCDPRVTPRKFRAVS
jgi:hypothetical protein